MSYHVTRKIVRLTLADENLRPILTVQDPAAARRHLVDFFEKLPDRTVAVLTFEGDVDDVMFGVSDGIVSLVQ